MLARGELGASSIENSFTSFINEGNELLDGKESEVKNNLLNHSIFYGHHKYQSRSIRDNGAPLRYGDKRARYRSTDHA